jgi:hypothetical protein
LHSCSNLYEGATVPDTTERADLIGFTLTHSLLRNEIPRLAAALSGGSMTSEQESVLEEHLRLVTDHLLRHHQEEDDFHWPVLASRASGAARLLALLEAEHAEMDPLVDKVRNRRLTRSERSVALSRLSELVLDHLEEEDRSVVPLLAVHITADEQSASMARSRANIPPDDELPVLAMMLAAADEDERRRMLGPLPEAVVSTWAQDEAPALRQVHRVLAEIAAAGPRQTPSHRTEK